MEISSHTRETIRVWLLTFNTWISPCSFSRVLNDMIYENPNGDCYILKYETTAAAAVIHSKSGKEARRWCYRRKASYATGSSSSVFTSVNTWRFLAISSLARYSS